jgi:peptide/nickel transport system substrate-binding protein
LEIVDPYTVKIIYKEPFSPGLESWGMGIIPQHIFEKGDFNNHPANRHPIGTGPYRFMEWKTDERIVLEANEDYFEGRPYIHRIIYRIVPDQAVQFLELRKETIDTMGLTPDQFQKEAVSKEFLDNFNKFRYPSFGYTYFGYNLKNPLFKDKRVRRAITYAINRQEIIDGILLGLGQISTGPFPPTSWAYNKTISVYEHNPEKAKKLLYNCGWQDRDGDGILDKDGRPFSFTLMTNQGNKMRQLCATIIQSNLKQVGIQVKIRILEWASLIHQYIDKKNFDAVILGWSLSRDPDQYSIWHSSQIKEGQYNFVSYSNPEVDRLLVEGRRTFDMEKRKKIYHKIHTILAEEQPYTFLYVADALPVVHKRFHGIEVAPAGIGYNFIKWYVPKDQQKYTR